MKRSLHSLYNQQILDTLYLGRVEGKEEEEEGNAQQKHILVVCLRLLLSWNRILQCILHLDSLFPTGG